MSAPEPLPGVRRVVTGHRDDGLAVVNNDTVVHSQEVGAMIPGARVAPIWRTGSLPVSDNNDETDGATRLPDGDLGLVMKEGTNLQFTDLPPGATTPAHRTSSLDHNILIVGKLILQMEDGSETLFENPGDVIIQRGTVHGWKNPGPGWTRWASVLIDAQSAIVKGVPIASQIASG